MTGDRQPRRRNPRQETRVAELLRQARISDEESRARALYEPLRMLTRLQEASNEYKTLFVKACEANDPLAYAAALQGLRDGLVDLLCQGDETLYKQIAIRDDDFVLRHVDRMTVGEFRALAESGTYFDKASIERSLRDLLREQAARMIEEAKAERVASDSAETPHSPAP